jgi:hypothetical protein
LEVVICVDQHLFCSLRQVCSCNNDNFQTMGLANAVVDQEVVG